MFDLSYTDWQPDKNQQFTPPDPLISPGPRISLLPSLNTNTQQQANPVNLNPSPTLTPPSAWDQLKVGDLQGLLGMNTPQDQQQPNIVDQLANFDFKGLASNPIVTNFVNAIPHGMSDAGMLKANTGFDNNLAQSSDPAMVAYAKQQLQNEQDRQNYLNANPVTGLSGMIGSQLAQIPLWASAEGLLGGAGKLLGKVTPSILPIADTVGSKLPSFVKGALMDVGTYGGVVAPTDNARQGGDLQSLLDLEKQQLPGVLLGSLGFRGAGKLLGEGVTGLKPEPQLGDFAQPMDTAVQDRYNSAQPQQAPQVAQPQEPPAITPQQQAYDAKLADLTDTFNKAPIASVDTPMATKTLQQNIDQAQGIGGPTGDHTQAGSEDAFGKPLNQYSINNDTQNNINEISFKMGEQLKGFETMIKQADEQTPVGTIRKQILDKGGIRQSNDGIFEEKRVIPNWIRNDKTGMPLDQMADELGTTSDNLLKAVNDSKYVAKNYASEAQKMADGNPEYQALGNTLQTLKDGLPGKRTLDVMPQLKPREATPNLAIEPSPTAEPFKRTTLSGNLPVDAPIVPPIVPPELPVTPERATWDNSNIIKGQEPFQGLKAKDAPAITPNETVNTPIGAPKDVQPIVADGVGSVPVGDGKVAAPITANEQANIPTPGNTKSGPLANDSTFWDQVKKESGWQGDTSSLQLGIKTGQIDPSKLSMSMNLQKFAEEYQNKYINETKMNFTGDSTKNDMLHQYVGNRDSNILNVNNLANDIRTNVKNPLDRMAATPYIQAGGDLSQINDRLAGKDGFMSAMEGKIADLKDTLQNTNMEPQAQKTTLKTIADYQAQLDEMNKRIPENLANLDKNYIQNGKDTGFTYKQILEKSKSLDANTKNWANEALTHNAELGTYSQKLGTVDNLEEYHMGQSWENPKLDTMNPDKIAANKELALAGKVQSSSSDGTSTNANAHKVYSDYATGIMHGETPRSLDMADVIQRQGVSMASKNANTEFVKGLVDSGVGITPDRVPEGYQEIYKSGGQRVVVPKELAHALNPILKPAFISESKIGNTLTDLQNKLKTINLGFSLFHYKNLAVAGLSNGDFKAFGDLAKAAPQIFKKMQDPAFREAEQEMIKTGQGMSSMVHGNLDTNMRLGNSLSPIGKVTDKLEDIPIAKQVTKGLEFNNKYLFEGVQRFYKVQAYATKAAAYIGKHPSATPAELFKANGSIAREINGTFGGLNWDSLGTNKTFLNNMRKIMLAPDWTYSNIDLAKQALTTKLGDPGGNAAKAYWARALVVGMAMTQGMNFLTTGSGTWHNPKGHETDAEVVPNVWASAFGGAIGDALKMTGNIAQHGTQGIPQFFQGKLAPLTRTALGILTNRDYTGKQLAGPKDGFVSGSLNGLGYIAKNILPLPFSASPLSNYLTKPDNPQTGDQRNALGTALLATGLGRYSADKPLSAFANPATKYAGNWLNSLLSPTDGASNDLINKINDQNKASSTNSTSINQQLGKALSNGDSTSSIFSNNSVPLAKQKQLLTAAQKKLATGQLSPLGQKFQSLSKAGQQQFLSGLSSDERATLGNVKLKTK